MRAESSSSNELRNGISLRLRLSAVFTLTFMFALTLVAVGSVSWLSRESTRRLDRRLTLLATGVSRAVQLESDEYPDSSLRAVAHDVQREWVVGPESWLIVDGARTVLATTTDSSNRERVQDARQSDPRTAAPIAIPRDGDDLRVVPLAVQASGSLPAYTILAVGSTESIERDSETLALALAMGATLIVLVSIGLGYVLSRWALRPTDTLGRAIDALGPAALSARLPVSMPLDEIGQLAQRFNALLDRLDASQAQNREFVREAAHQIRTPLTLVRGEAELALRATTPDVATLYDALARVERASRQMQRRVDELLLLAEAEAGAVLEQRAEVELDALAVDGVDLFRARATQFRRPLAYGVLEPATVMGDEALLREALLELLENACRYGNEETPITVSVRRRDTRVELVVESQRATMTPASSDSKRTGLGQRIVRWIAEVHDGHFELRHDAAGRYTAVLTLRSSSESPPALQSPAPSS